MNTDSPGANTRAQRPFNGLSAWNAERYPEVVRRIAAAGHEIASHGYARRLIDLIDDQIPEAFRSDTTRAKAILEDITGTAVRGGTNTISPLLGRQLHSSMSRQRHNASGGLPSG